MKQISVDQLKDRFNQERDCVKLLTIFSPTCLLCQYGQGVIAELYEKIGADADTPALEGFSIWQPVMDGDNLAAAKTQAEGFPHGSTEHIWDGETVFGNLFAKTLNLKGVAWDVYLLYGPGVMWNSDAPPEPTFWMHQLPPKTGANGKFLLSPARLAHELMGLLGKDDVETAWDEAFTLHAKGLGAVRTDEAQSTLDEVLIAVDPEKAPTRKTYGK
jgi:hypothetical protein